MDNTKFKIGECVRVKSTLKDVSGIEDLIGKDGCILDLRYVGGLSKRTQYIVQMEKE